MGVLYFSPPPLLFVLYIGNRGIVDLGGELEDKVLYCSTLSVSSLDLLKFKIFRFCKKCRVVDGDELEGELGFPVLLPAFFFCLKFIRKSLVFVLPETCISSQN